MARSSTVAGPRGWSPVSITKRFAESAPAPASYDASSHSCDAILSEGSAVQRFYGIEKLLIRSSAINVDRVLSGNCPFLDSHNAGSISNALGRIATTWVRAGALWGRIVFNQTAEGKKAEGMVARGELRSISCGYSVQSWEVTDENGSILDADPVGWDDTGLTFTATAWTLFEASLVSIPADNSAGVRSLGVGGDNIAATRARMLMRQRMYERASPLDAKGRVK
jgi:hypothetical protein